MILVKRRLVFALVLGGLVPAFAVTHLLVSQYKARRLRLADEWSERGNRDLAASPAAAAVEFQTALAYGPDRTTNRLRLAQALAAAQRPAEARAELLTLWAAAPGDGEINLALARIAATTGNVPDAVRYYHAAIDGAWDSGAVSARRLARLEAARLLLAAGQRLAAQSELIALIDDLPSEPAALTEVGGLLADSGADQRALALLRRALTLDPGNLTAATRAGRIAFRLGDYRGARTLLTSASARAPLDPETQTMLQVSARVLLLDPSARGLGTRARAQRVLQDLTIASSRLERCQAAPTADEAMASQLTDLSDRVQKARKVSRLALQRDAELTEQTVSLVFAIEALPESQCGDASTDDRALQLIAERRQPPAR
jgi:tetratricopeptide (TPR) repeat protein